MSSRSSSGAGSRSEPRVEEPLLDSALTALEQAPTTCPSGEHSCMAYHQLWPWLRLLDLASSPERQGGFFAEQLRAVRRTDPPTDVLVSGCADQSMLAHVAATISPVRATAVDACRTPLELCARFAADRDDIDLDLVHEDVRDLHAGPFDLICTHSFLSQFSRDDRPGLVEAWRRLVKPDGRVITSTRLDPSGTGGTFDVRAGTAFVERVSTAAAADDRPLVRDRADDLRAIAQQYVRSLRVHPLASAEELDVLFRAAGFSQVRVSIRHIAGEPPNRAGPGIRQAADYAEVVASP